MNPVHKRVGVVVIARNEGDRLIRCIDSLQNDEDFAGCPTVYVDSGSTDGSRAFVRSRGIPVHELAPPFTMAAARNAGFEMLVRDYPDLEFVQFLDGDCTVAPGWGAAALIAFDCHQSGMSQRNDPNANGETKAGPGREVAIVCGRRREQFPAASVYNRFIDQEWDRPPGETEACGGDFMIRTGAFAAVRGFRASLICGEEPEMCLRLRELTDETPRRVVRIASEMTAHDAALHDFSAWWRRAIRGGWACAEGFFLHGRKTAYRLRECLRIVFYGGVLPAATIACLAFAYLSQRSEFWPVALVGPAAYALLFVRLLRRQLTTGTRLSDAWRFAGLSTLDKFAGLAGVALFIWRSALGRGPRLIEYKGRDSSNQKEDRPVDQTATPIPRDGRAPFSVPKLQSAVIGTGVIAEEHLAHLEASPRAELRAICDLSPAAARAAANRYGAAAVFTDWRRMLCEAQPDVVHILTPPATHFEFARECLQAGCHVIVEKPATLAVDELEFLLQLARDRGLHLIENHNYRFNETMRELEGRIASGAIGRVTDLEIRLALPLRLKAGRYSDPNLKHPSHRLPAGVIHEFLTHLCYLTLRLMPAEYRLDYAGLSNLGEAGVFVYDDLDVLLSGCPASDGPPVRGRIRFCAYAQPAEFSVSVRGSDGAIRSDLFHPGLQLDRERDIKGLSQVLNQLRGAASLMRAGLDNLKRKLLQRTPYEGLETLLEASYTAIATGGPPPVEPADMLAAARLIDEILQSVNTRQAYA